MLANQCIIIKNVSFLRQSQFVVENLSFAVKKGECVLLLGPNGSGKTTTLNLIAGLIRPHQGEILIHNQNVHQNRVNAKRHVGFLPEHLPLYPELTVKEYLDWISQIRLMTKSDRSEAIAEILETLALKEVQHHLVGVLSKGLKQRVGLAQAMLHRPSVLLLDEPTTGLDKDQTEMLIERLTHYKQEAAIILSTHHDLEMGTLCDRIIQFTAKSKESKHYDLDHCTT